LTKSGFRVVISSKSSCSSSFSCFFHARNASSESKSSRRKGKRLLEEPCEVDDGAGGEETESWATALMMLFRSLKAACRKSVSAIQ
jgi:hypothetical protein